MMFLNRKKATKRALPRSLSRENFWKKRKEKWERSRGMQVFLWFTLVVLLLYAVFAFLYTSVVIYVSGVSTSFLWFWPVTFFIALFAVIGLFLVLTGRLPQFKLVAMGFAFAFWLLFAVFLAVEGIIFFAGRKEPEQGASYVIVLGAQVRGEVPTLVLDARIKAAAEYLKEYPDAVAIASGGQGTGESISEAEAIKRGLLRLGIAEERILLETGSTSTMENLRFSAEMIRETGRAEEGKIYFVPEKVVLVTNDFHIFRATRLAKKLGYADVSGLGAREFFAVTIQYYVREFFAVVKELLQGNF